LKDRRLWIFVAANALSMDRVFAVEQLDREVSGEGPSLAWMTGGAVHLDPPLFALIGGPPGDGFRCGWWTGRSRHRPRGFVSAW